MEAAIISASKQIKFLEGLENILITYLQHHPHIFTLALRKDDGNDCFFYSITSRSEFEDVLNRKVGMHIDFFFDDGSMNMCIPDGTYYLVESDCNDSSLEGTLPSLATPLKLMAFCEVMRSRVAYESAVQLVDTLKVFNKMQRDIKKYVARRGIRLRGKIGEEQFVGGLERTEEEGETYFFPVEQLTYLNYMIK